jgi:Reverse transcriptase (RNA-dependent DNA polymerase)
VLFFADDLVLIGKSPEAVQRLLTVLESFCDKNDLVVNVKKTKVMSFGKSAGPVQLEYKG